MYMTLYWVNNDYVTAIQNENGSIKLFETVKEVDKYANKQRNSDGLRVISIEGVM